MILDTNALSAVADNQATAVAGYKEADLIALAVIVLGKFRFGITRSGKRNDDESWLRSSLSSHESWISVVHHRGVCPRAYGVEEARPAHSRQ